MHAHLPGVQIFAPGRVAPTIAKAGTLRASVRSMANRITFFAAAALTLGVGCKASIDDRCDEGCPSFLLGSTEHCDRYCAYARDLASASGCVAEHRSLYACLATEGWSSGACEEADARLFNCVGMSPPTGCTQECYECDSSLDCPIICPVLAASAAAQGCSEEWLRVDECGVGDPPEVCASGSCTMEEIDALSACVDTYCSAHPEDC